MALGHQQAGLFATDDALAEKLRVAGEATGELVWRMPLATDYDKMIDFAFADVKNTGGRWAGSITGGAVPQALRQGDALGASRHRRRRDGLAADRDQPLLVVGLGRAASRPAGRGQLRGIGSIEEEAGVTEVLFYHLDRQPLERVLPDLLESCLERGWRAVVQVGSDERLEALDAHLWTYRDESFLPHGTEKDGRAAEQPVFAHHGRRQSERRQRSASSPTAPMSRISRPISAS